MNIKKEIIKGSNGYGYKIYKNNTLFIIQEYAPAISGNITMTEQQAGILSDLVVKKLEDRPNELPTLTLIEVMEVLGK